jgi:transcriptional regulator with GAF, ATPase, and Fis domain
MTINKEIFFREITRRICSSLDIKSSFKRSFEYLRQILPLEEMFLDIHDTQLGAIRRIAYAAVQKSQGHDDIIPLPKEVWDWAQSFDKPIILDSRNKNALAGTMAALVKLQGNSDLAVPLHIESKSIGILILRAKGDGVYREEHSELISLASDPFAIALSNALAHQELLHYRDLLLDDNRFLQRELSHGVIDDIIGERGGLRNVMEMVRQVASFNNTVLLLGETGVGKEVIANAIHYGSARGNGPFIKVNCGAIPETLIDSELFRPVQLGITLL